MPVESREYLVRIEWGGRNRYVHNNGDVNSLMGFLGETGGWTFWNRNDGYLWSSAYGWLHDYFFYYVGNCASSNSGRYAINCYGAGDVLYALDYELIDNGGQVALRSVRLYTQCNCNCACDCVTCFPAGSLVLMADGTEKLIETVEKTDLVMGGDGSPVKIDYLHVSHLGKRKMLSFAEDRTLSWSDEHLFWVKKEDKQWWWTASHKSWIHEVEIGAVAGLKDNYSHFTDNNVEFANLDGFVKRTVIDVTDQYLEGNMTKVYLPISSNGEPIIVNGYVVTGGTDESKYDYTKFDWAQNLQKVKGVLKK